MSGVVAAHFSVGPGTAPFMFASRTSKPITSHLSTRLHLLPQPIPGWASCLALLGNDDKLQRPAAAGLGYAILQTTAIAAMSSRQSAAPSITSRDTQIDARWAGRPALKLDGEIRDAEGRPRFR
jgi:hypothetical protein